MARNYSIDQSNDELNEFDVDHRAACLLRFPGNKWGVILLARGDTSSSVVHSELPSIER